MLTNEPRRQAVLGSLLRSFVGILGLVAVITEIAVGTHRGVFVWHHFFSYFTIQSNLLAAGFLLTYAVIGRRADACSRPVLQSIRAAVTCYVVLAGVGYVLMMIGVDGAPSPHLWWDDLVLHGIVPAAMLADWLLHPPRVRMRPRMIVGWAAYPIGYVAWSLVRGQIDRAAAAILASGKLLGSTAASGKVAKEMVGRGYRFIVPGSDVTLLGLGVRTTLADARG